MGHVAIYCTNNLFPCGNMICVKAYAILTYYVPSQYDVEGCEIHKCLWKALLMSNR